MKNNKFGFVFLSMLSIITVMITSGLSPSYNPPACVNTIKDVCNAR